MNDTQTPTAQTISADEALSRAVSCAETAAAALRQNPVLQEEFGGPTAADYAAVATTWASIATAIATVESGREPAPGPRRQLRA